MKLGDSTKPHRNPGVWGTLDPWSGQCFGVGTATQDGVSSHLPQRTWDEEDGAKPTRCSCRDVVEKPRIGGEPFREGNGNEPSSSTHAGAIPEHPPIYLEHFAHPTLRKRHEGWGTQDC
jgi:hypothetical protein